MNKLMLGLLAFSALGFISFPAVAGDNVSVDDVKLTTVVTGDGNYSEHDVHTTTFDSSTGPRNGNQGHVTRTNSTIDVVGNDNETVHTIERRQIRVRQQ